MLGVENIEKAQLLTQAADYTRQLQVSLMPRRCGSLECSAQCPELAPPSVMQWCRMMQQEHCHEIHSFLTLINKKVYLTSMLQ